MRARLQRHDEGSALFKMVVESGPVPGERKRRESILSKIPFHVRGKNPMRGARKQSLLNMAHIRRWDFRSAFVAAASTASPSQYWQHRIRPFPALQTGRRAIRPVKRLQPEQPQHDNQETGDPGAAQHWRSDQCTATMMRIRAAMATRMSNRSRSPMYPAAKSACALFALEAS